VPGLIENGRYEHSYMGISGVTFSPICSDEQGLDKSQRGFIVDRVLGNTPAARAGLRGSSRTVQTEFSAVCPNGSGGDFVIAVDGQAVTTFDDLLVYSGAQHQPRRHDYADRIARRRDARRAAGAGAATKLIFCNAQPLSDATCISLSDLLAF
jgi:hypothetical protein